MSKCSFFRILKGIQIKIFNTEKRKELDRIEIANTRGAKNHDDDDNFRVNNNNDIYNNIFNIIENINGKRNMLAF